MPTRDPEKKRAYEREWRRRKYAEDPEYRARKKATDKAWSDKLRQEIREHKLELGCCRCGYQRCADALHFHHRDGSEKELAVGDLIRYSRMRVWDEIAKCDLVCANCHAEIHARVWGFEPLVAHLGRS